MSDPSSERSLRRAAAVESLGEGRFRVQLSDYFSVVGHPNGGYLQCVMANAAVTAAAEQGASHRFATAITTNYVGSPVTGTAEISVDVRRVGKGTSFAHVELREKGELTTESLVTLGHLVADDRLRYQDAPVFDVPPLESCVKSRVPDSDPNISHSVDMRLDPACVGWWQGEPTDRGEIRGWIRLDDTTDEWDAWSVLFASDAMPPATFPLGSVGWVPTLQLTSYVRAVPQSEWLRIRQYCVVVADNLVDERCEILDARDRLVASSTQLAMVRFPHH